MAIGQFVATYHAAIATTAIAVGIIADNPTITSIGFALLGGVSDFGVAQKALIGFASGAAGNRGDFRSGLYSSFAAIAFHGVGETFGEVTTLSGAHLGKIVAHGVVGGAFQSAQGGSFSAGFLSAGAAELAAPSMMKMQNAPGQIVTAAMVGGTASELGGGKFSNGAITGAFVMAFNHGIEKASAEGAPPGAYDDGWELVGRLQDMGSELAVDAGRFLMIEIESGTFGLDGRHVSLWADPIDASGNLLPSMRASRGIAPFGRGLRPIAPDFSAGGQSGFYASSRRVYDAGPVNTFSSGYRWRVTMPRQNVPHGASMGFEARVYRREME